MFLASIIPNLLDINGFRRIMKFSVGLFRPPKTFLFCVCSHLGILNATLLEKDCLTNMIHIVVGGLLALTCCALCFDYRRAGAFL